jgi:xanthine dehydrogenase accessory factor
MEEDGRFIAVHNPPLRLIVVGAVHIAQPLLTIARECGYRCTLIDPRAAFGSSARFPDEVILDDWPDEALTTLAPDSRTAIVTLTHDPKLDDPAIKIALQSQAFYLGCLGSKKTHTKRLDRLTAAGFTPDEIARIHAPVGLDIGAKTPAEIAVSIMAQITQALRS